MPPPKKPRAEKLVSLNTLVRPDQREAVEEIGGPDGLGSGARLVLDAGLSCMRSGGLLSKPVDELHKLADQLARITGRTTGSGAWWCPTPEALPDVAALDLVHGDVLVTPDSVGLMADSTLAVDSTAEALVIVTSDGRELRRSLDLHEISALAINILAGLAQLAAHGPGACEVLQGVTLERCGDGRVRLSVQGCGPACSPTAAQTFGAEVAALACRITRQSITRRQALEAQLQEVA